MKAEEEEEDGEEEKKKRRRREEEEGEESEKKKGRKLFCNGRHVRMAATSRAPLTPATAPFGSDSDHNRCQIQSFSLKIRCTAEVESSHCGLRLDL